MCLNVDSQCRPYPLFPSAFLTLTENSEKGNDAISDLTFNRTTIQN